MEDIEQLLKKVNQLEYTEIKGLKDKVGSLELKIEKNSLLTDQVVQSNEKLSSVMDTMKEAMLEITNGLKDSNRISSELAETVKNLNDKVEKVQDKMDSKFHAMDEKISKIDEKAKIDWQQWIKNNWFKLSTLLIALAYLVLKIFDVKVF